MFILLADFIIFFNLLSVLLFVHAKSALSECDIGFLGVASHVHFLNKNGLLGTI